MKTITLKDLKLKVEENREPKYLGMKKKDIYKISEHSACIYWYDKDWKEIYYENYSKYWDKREYKDWEEIYFEDSDKYWWKREYKDWKVIYFEDSNKYWWKREYKDW